EPTPPSGYDLLAWPRAESLEWRILERGLITQVKWQDGSEMARVCIVWQHRILAETRVGREINALAEAGHQVDVICLRGAGQPRFERRGDVTFRRLSLRRR